MSGDSFKYVPCTTEADLTERDFPDMSCVHCLDTGNMYIVCDGKLIYYCDFDELVISNVVEDMPTNCYNCGAPLVSGVCEYCGTRYY